jgi:hypothetical protein
MLPTSHSRTADAILSMQGAVVMVLVVLVVGLAGGLLKTF